MSKSLKFLRLISRKGAELGHMLLLNIIGNRIDRVQWRYLSYLTLSDLERSKSRSLRFRSIISRKKVELGHTILLDTTRKPYMGCPITLWRLSDHERSKSRSLRFWSSISRKGAELGHMLLLNINRKVYTGSPFVWSHLTLLTLKSQCQGHSDFEGLYLVKELS